MNSEIHRHLLVTPKQFAVANGQMIDGKRKKLLYASIHRNRQLHSESRDVGRRTVRANCDMDDRVIQHDRIKTKLCAHQRNYFQLREQTVGVGEGHMRRIFFSVDRDVAYFRLEAKWNGMDAADFGTASGDAFDFRDHAARTRPEKSQC